MSAFSFAIEFSLIDGLSKGLLAIRDRIHGIARANHEVKKSFDNMVTAGKYAAFAGLATREIARGLKPAITAAGDLQEELLGVEAEIGGAGKSASTLTKELALVKKTAFSVQAWTPFDEGNIVALEKELLKAGAKMEAVIAKGGATEAAAALATYEKMDPTVVGKNLVSIGTPFKVAAKDYMELADQISRASSSATVGAQEIAETAKYAAPVMSNLKKTPQEMFALSALLSKSGLEASMAGTGLRQFFQGATKVREFKDAKGNLKSTVEMIDILKKKLAGKGDAEKYQILTKMFDLRGAPVAMALLDQQDDALKSIIDDMHRQNSLQEKLNISMKGFNKQWSALKNNVKSVAADLYLPALDILKPFVEEANKAITAIGELSARNKGVGKVVSGLSLGTIATTGAATVGLGTAAVLYGRKVLKGVGGIKGLLGKGAGLTGGIATGKAVEAVTGVTPVFVTNWPQGVGNIAGAYSPLPQMPPPKAGPLTSGGFVEGIKKTPGFLKGLIPKLTGGVATAGLGTTGLAVAGSGAIGYGAGRLAGENIAWGGKSLDDHVQDLFARLFLSKKEQEDYFAPTINVNVDRDGRAVVEYDGQGKAKAKINVKREKF